MRERLRHILANTLAGLLRLNSRPLPLRGSPALVIAPHADDETLGCGGLLAAKSALGQPIAVAFLTDSAGPRGDRSLSAQRSAEARAALQLLGVPAAQTYFLDAPDGRLDRLTVGEAASLESRLTVLLQQYRPAEVFLPFLGGGSTEHDAASWLTRAALTRAGQQPRLWEYPIWAWWNALRLRDRVLRHDGNFRLALTPEQRECKRQALACHHSQLGTAPGAGAFRLPAVLARRAAAPDEFYFSVPS